MKTDLQLQQDVLAELKWEPALHAAQIGVEVKDGVVTLVGEVATFHEKLYAERAAQRVAGVRALAVELKVKFGVISGVTGVSNEIAIKPTIQTVVKSDIEAALKRGAGADAKTISVAVDGGDVTLTGTVNSWAERDLATHSVWASAGVRNVFDKMNIVY